jgi:F-type H+-transporting ATPase subunit alpha
LNQIILPYTTTSIAEVYRDAGYNALVIYDSLTNHAIAHRQLSLVNGAIPGREAYPADTFYLHAHLLERSCQLRKKLGYGSITSLSVVEIFANVITTYVPTNLISIADGQFFMDADLSRSYNWPAISLAYSVSRIGTKAQPIFLRTLVSDTLNILSDFNHYHLLLSAGESLSTTEMYIYNKGMCLKNLFIQRRPRFFEENVILILAAHLGLLCPNKTEESCTLLLDNLYKKQPGLIAFTLTNKRC